MFFGSILTLKVVARHKSDNSQSFVLCPITKREATIEATSSQVCIHHKNKLKHVKVEST